MSRGQPVRVKICGITTPDEARLAVDLGADFLGLNFYPLSPRYLETEAAVEIAAAVHESGRDVKLVGVFVNRPAGDIDAIRDRVGLDLLQFHGDETRESLGGLNAQAIKVFRIRGRVDSDVISDLISDLISDYGDVWGYLFDYRHPVLYGGSGESWDFSSFAKLRFDKPTFIAGGLGPDNVRAAVEASSPWGIDVCSGVEAAPGKKDPELLARLFEEIAEFRKEIHHGRSPITS